MKKMRFLFFPVAALLLGFVSLNFVSGTLPSAFEIKRSGADFAVFHYTPLGQVDEYYKVQGCDWDISNVSIKHVEYRPKTDLALVDSNGNRYVFITKPENEPADKSVKTFQVIGFGHFEMKDGVGWPLEKMEKHAFNKE